MATQQSPHETELKEKNLEQRIEEALLAGGYERRYMDTYDKGHALDTSMLLDFLKKTQEAVYNKLRLYDAVSCNRFLDRLAGELRRRGVIDVLRSGISHEQCNKIRLYHALPDDDNATAKALYQENTFGMIRQLAYSQPHVQDPGILDIGLYINGIPVLTIELKNEYSGQNVRHAILQYQNDRDPKEPLLVPGRCMVHFAVDTHEVYMCSTLRGKSSRFLPFNKGREDGSAGNPANPDGFATAYLWDRILQPDSLCDIIEHYAGRVEDKKNGKKAHQNIFPRYHQLDATRKLLSDVRQNGTGRKYLIQHSAGSGKSNTISWLALQLTNTRKSDGTHAFDMVIVVTDRLNLDDQTSTNIFRFSRMKSSILHARKGSELRDALVPDSPIRIVVSTIQKFPVLLRDMQEYTGKSFAIIIDEAHSSQGGENAAALNRVLGIAGVDDYQVEEDDELLDVLAQCTSEEEKEVQLLAHRRAKLRKLVDNASYFAFTATPKVKTLRMFGELSPDGTYGPFHHYSMKQAIQEGYILDVLACYTPIKSYFRLRPRDGEDSQEEYDANKAQAKLKKLAESNLAAVKEKSRIMVGHFLRQGSRQIAGQARAIVVCASIQRAIDYFYAIRSELKRQGSHFLPIIAFSGEKEIDGEKWTEARINGFPSSYITEKIQEDPYRILVVADKFQTGYDEPLMQTMYVDKKLSGVKTVQTLSRLNRARADKFRTFVLDFYNDEESIRKDFEPYYTTTILSGDCDANKLHDMKSELDDMEIYTNGDLNAAVRIYLTMPEGNQELASILDICRDRFILLAQEEKIQFKGTARGFVRYYDFLSTVLPYANAEWEKLACFLRLLLKVLPSIGTGGDDHITDAVELESYRAELGRAIQIRLTDDEGGMKPPNPTGGGASQEPDLKPLSDILSAFHDAFGNIQWTDEDNVRAILDRLAPVMALDITVADAIKNSDEANMRLALGKAVGDYFTKQVIQSSGRMDDMVKLMDLYSNKDSSFSSMLLDGLLSRLRRVRWSYDSNDITSGELLVADNKA